MPKGSGAKAFLALLVVAAIYATPLGWMLNTVLAGGALLIAGYLVLRATVEAFDIKNASDPLHWRSIGLMIAGAVGLVIFAFVCMTILPLPPNIGSDALCVPSGRYGESCVTTGR